MKLKLDAEGKPELKDGLPVFVSEDGTEQAIDVAKMRGDLSNANKEAADRRHELDRANARLKLYGDIDPDKAREAMAFREALGEGVDPSKVQTEVADLKAKNASLTTQLEEKNGELEAQGATIDDLSRGAAISSSSFVREKMIPAFQDRAVFDAAYGDRVKRDKDGKVYVVGADGNPILSEKNAGQYATLDEALPKIVTSDIHLAPNGAGGSGDKGGGKGGDTPAVTGKLSEMSTGDKAAALRAHVEAGGTAESFIEASGN